ncbi:sialate:O-sulfotransferase 1-like [Ptychodera flava]|uniref:sialate:O-sulfotransferase 1-like n=1 Tax=Ptychodera flava TaxID=63121 RepID=UPI003969DA4E
MIRKYHAVILLLRNPYGSLAAEYNRKQGGQMFYERWGDDAVEREEFLQAIGAELKCWSNITINALLCEECLLLVVHYEDLVERTNEQLHNILKFLNFSVDEDRFRCVENDKEGQYHRGVPKDERTRQYHMLRTLDTRFDIDGKIKSVSKLLVSRGYLPIRQYVV